MIVLNKKTDCCGCGACMQRCPKHCISMQEDEEGFLYPHVDKSICINCGLCEEVCPIIHQNEPHKPIETFAAKNPDEDIRMKSSSGGIFSMLAEKIINEGGVVFGAKFNEQWEVEHDYTETLEGLSDFRGSKYVQSRIGNCFSQAEGFLKAGRKVLFSGTPCQIAGLNRFLRKEYDNLLTVDVICHGVPSPKVWRDYLKKIARDGNINYISFRNKSRGWRDGSMKFVIADKVIIQSIWKNLYSLGFLSDIYLRPNCFVCSAKAGKSRSDITIGDFWGIWNCYPKYDDDKGVSAVLINTEKGKQYYQSLNVADIPCQYDEIVAGNYSLIKSTSYTKFRLAFWKMYKKEGVDSVEKTLKRMEPSIVSRGIHFFKRIIKRIIGRE